MKVVVNMKTGDETSNCILSAMTSPDLIIELRKYLGKPIEMALLNFS